jgi:hypothetical protein
MRYYLFVENTVDISELYEKLKQSTQPGIQFSGIKTHLYLTQRSIVIDTVMFKDMCMYKNIKHILTLVGYNDTYEVLKPLTKDMMI